MNLCKVCCQLYTIIGVERQERPLLAEVIRKGLWKKGFFLSLKAIINQTLEAEGDMYKDTKS